MKTVIIYGKDNCPNCNNARNFCKIQKLNYVEYKIGVDIKKEEIEEMAGKKITSAPQIFIMENGQSDYVGGWEEFKKMRF